MVCAAALLVGFLTPIAGTSIAVVNSVIGVGCLLNANVCANERALIALYLAVMSIVLVPLGPGAFSLDARFFGRREIIFPESRRRPTGS